MVADRKSKLLKALEPRLSLDQKRLIPLLTFENRKDKLVVRMPTGVISLETIWLHMRDLAFDLNIPCERAGSFATLDELDDILGDIRWLWKGWLPEGFVTLLIGDPGVGKSLVAMDLVKRVSNGECWPLCNDRVEPAHAVWIDTEASQQLLRLRSIKLGVNRRNIAIPVIGGDILAQVDISNQDHREYIVSMMDGFKPRLLVIDSLSGSHTRGENKVEDIKPIMEFYALLARDYHAAVLITHHLNKGQADSPEIALYRTRGSTAIPQYARSVVSLERIADNHSKLRVIKTNLAMIGQPLSIHTEADDEGEITSLRYDPYVPPKPKRNKKEACAAWVESIIDRADGEGVALSDLTDMGIAEGYTRQNLYAAREVLGDRLMVTGTGNRAFWHKVNSNDTQSILQLQNGGDSE